MKHEIIPPEVLAFIEYIEDVERLCRELYGIDSADLGLDDPDLLASSQKEGAAPEELVRWKGERYNLILLREARAYR
jgi:hypothetical protein